eukprot:15312052-Alexandrium_andersonii.AAC.1
MAPWYTAAGAMDGAQHGGAGRPEEESARPVPEDARRCSARGRRGGHQRTGRCATGLAQGGPQAGPRP